MNAAKWPFARRAGPNIIWPLYIVLVLLVWWLCFESLFESPIGSITTAAIFPFILRLALELLASVYAIADELGAIRKGLEPKPIVAIVQQSVDPGDYDVMVILPFSAKEQWFRVPAETDAVARAKVEAMHMGSAHGQSVL